MFIWQLYLSHIKKLLLDVGVAYRKQQTLGQTNGGQNFFKGALESWVSHLKGLEV